MRKLKTPEEIRRSNGNWATYSPTEVEKLIIAAQRDALECADDMAGKFKNLMSKMAQNDIALAEFTEAWNTLLEFRKIQLDNLMPKEK